MNKAMSIIKWAVTFIDRYHWALLIVAAPSLLFPAPNRIFVLLIIPLIWLCAWLVRREAVPRTPLNGAVLLLSITLLISLYATYDLAVSLPKIVGLVLGIATVFAVVRESSSSRGWWVCLGFLSIIAVGMSVAALLGTAWIDKFDPLTSVTSHLPRGFARMLGQEAFSPNQVAGSLLWVIPLLGSVTATSMWGGKRTRPEASRPMSHIFLLVITLFLTGVFILTQSRTAFLALGLALMLGVLFLIPRPWNWLALNATILVGVVERNILGQYVLRFAQGGITTSRAFSLDTLTGRIEVWARAIDAIRDVPFTGLGMNTFRSVVHVLYPFSSIGPDFDIAHAHNEYLQAALDLGLPGLIAFLALNILALCMLFQVMRTGLVPSTRGREQRWWAIGLMCALVAHAVFGLTDAVALGAKTGILFWMLLGLICGLFSQSRQEVAVRDTN